MHHKIIRVYRIDVVNQVEALRRINDPETGQNLFKQVLKQIFG